MSNKKQTEEERIIQNAADLIMQTIRVAANRIANKYERMLAEEVISRLQLEEEVKKEVRETTTQIITEKLDNL